jgi:hypothetical protein
MLLVLQVKHSRSSLVVARHPQFPHFKEARQWHRLQSMSCNVDANKCTVLFPQVHDLNTRFGARPCIGLAGSPLCASASALHAISDIQCKACLRACHCEAAADAWPTCKSLAMQHSCSKTPRLLAPALLAHERERLALHLVQEGDKAARARRARVRVLQQPAREGLHVVVPGVEYRV